MSLYIRTFKPLPPSLALEQLLLTIVWDMTSEVGDLTDRVKLELLVVCFEKLILILVRRVATFPTNGTASEYGLILGDLLLLACSGRRRRAAKTGSGTID